MPKPLIMIVEDDAVIAELLAFNLENEEYRSQRFADARELFAGLEQSSAVDLFILDIMLPGKDGFEICAELRKRPQFENVPILMLTARGAENDKVHGLEAGADDYLTKPFGMRELMARIQALLRRYAKTMNSVETAADNPVTEQSEKVIDDPSGKIRVGDLLLDDIKHRIYKNEDEIEVTHREFELLKFLMIHRGAAYSRDDLLNLVWGYEYSGETRTVDVHIRQLRRKIENDDANPVYIETVRGRGYRFTDQLL